MPIRPTIAALGLTALAAALAAAPFRDARAQLEPGHPHPPGPSPEATATSQAEPDLAPPASTETGVEWELAGEAVYVTPPIHGGATPFGAGFGARIGISLSGFYVGLTLVDFLGSKDVDVSYRALLYGVELGYGFRVAAFGGAFWVMRPRLGVGDAAVYYTDPSLLADVVTSASGSSSASDTLTVNNVYLQPGLTFQLASSAHFVAIDGSMLVLPGIVYGGADATTWISYGAQVQLGFHF